MYHAQDTLACVLMPTGFSILLKLTIDDWYTMNIQGLLRYASMMLEAGNLIASH